MRNRGNALVVVAALVLGMVTTTPLTARAATEPPPVCQPSSRNGVDVRITSPAPGSTIDQAKQPEFSVRGIVTGASASPKVRAYMDGTYVGEASVAATGGRATWAYPASAPAGRHVITVCASTAEGAAQAGAAVTVTLKAPAPGATVVSPNAKPLSKGQAADLAEVTPSTVRFASAQPFAAGQVLVAGVTPKTPAGLLRRITRVARSGDGTVLTTSKASLTDVLLQADIDLKNVPLSGVGAGVRALGPQASVGGDAVKAVTFKAQQEILSAGPPAFKGSIATELSAKLDVRIKIRLSFGLSGPKASLETARIVLSGDAKAELKYSVSAGGKIEYKRNVVQGIKLGRIVVTLAGVVPVVITPEASMDFAASGKVLAKTEFGSSLAMHLDGGVEYRDGGLRNIGGATLSSKFDSPFTSEGRIDGSAQADFSAALIPRLSFDINALGGPFVAMPVGVKGSLAYPCPGSVSVGAFAEVQIGGKLELVGKELGSASGTVAKVYRQALGGPAPGCDTPTSPLVLEGESAFTIETDEPFDQQLTATGGASPYVFSLATGTLPPGLTLSEQGRIAGRPTRAASFAVNVRVEDSRGEQVEKELTFDIRRRHLAVETVSLSDAFVNVDYAGSLRGSGGQTPYEWRVTGLPAGLTAARDGKVTGVPTAVGMATAEVTLTDAIGQEVKTSLPLRVEDAIPGPVEEGGVEAPLTPVTANGPNASTWGDPHQVTFDGAAYDLQAVGEFVLTRSTVDDFQVQTRQIPFDGSSRALAGNAGVAMGVAGHRASVLVEGAGARILVDGAQVSPAEEGIALPGGGRIAHSVGERRVTTTWPDGSKVTADYHPGTRHIDLFVSLAATRQGAMEGLLGDGDSDPSDDLRIRDGAVLPQGASAQQVLGEFAPSWRITQETSLFDYAAGQDTSTFTDLAFPYGSLTYDALPDAERTAAEAVCRASGLSDGAAVQACTLDVAATGDKSLARGAAVSQKFTSFDPLPAGITAASAPGDSWTRASGESGQAVFSKGHDGCNDVDEKGDCVGGIWSVFPGAKWIWATNPVEPEKPTTTFTKTVRLTAQQAAVPQVLAVLVDDRAVVKVNGATVLDADNFGGGSVAGVVMRPGDNTLSFDVTNLGGPAGLAWWLAPSDDKKTVVSGKANIFAAGSQALPPLGGGPGTLPSYVDMADFSELSIDATGEVGCANSPQVAGPDGGTCASSDGTDIASLGAISGLSHSTATGFLVGVFTDGNVDAATPAPVRLDFGPGGLGTDFASFTPALRQTFFLGDGKNAAGDVQRFIKPPGATRLYLGIVDAAGFHGEPCCYDDNYGKFDLSVTRKP